MTPAPAPRAALRWHKRLEARVALGLGLVVATALGAVLAITIRVVTDQSRDRAATELDVARTVFYNLLEARIATAISVAELVTELPVFRAHLTDARLRRNRASVAVMTEEYRAQMDATFAIVSHGDGAWLASPGWPSRPTPPDDAVRATVDTARAGRATGRVVALGGDLFLTVSVPARVAGEILGTLTVGYRLSDGLAKQLAEVARCEVLLISHRQIAATSLGVRDLPSTRLASVAAEIPGVLAARQPIGGREYIAGVFSLTPEDAGSGAGHLLLLSDWQPTQQFIDRLETRFLAAGLATLSLSLLGGALFSRRLSRPLEDIASAASEIAAGNLALQMPERGTAEAVTVAQAFNDMSASLRTARDRLVHDAIHDHLTKLPNRALFRERLDRALTRRVRHPDYRFAVLFVDLDRFKHVNDSLGHSAGDRLLVLFAERLATAVRRDDVVMRWAGDPSAPEPTLARLGGDEFAVLLDDIREPIDAVRVAKRIQVAATQPFPLDGQEVFTSASVGVAVVDPAHRSAEDVIRDADLAMYRAKQSGGGNYAVFDTALHDAAVRRLRLETDLRRAVDRREFRLWYQPIVSLADRRVVGLEALVRWQHPERGLLPPADFLHVAEEVGLIGHIDEWVLWEACRQGCEWARAHAHAEPPAISVNLSAKSFAQGKLVQKVADSLHTTGFPASRLRLEITESVAITDAEHARAVLVDLRALGVRVSLDDFGTGYCSLSYLQRFPIDTLKIDRSFVAGIGVDDGRGEIIKLIVGLARTLNLDVVAEGTETAAQVEFLIALGCGYGQGYYFARPAGPDEVAG